MSNAGETEPRVFICHAGDDQDRFVTDFARSLIAHGVDAWYSKWEMRPGDSLVDKVFEEGIAEADALIIVLSTKSVDKPWVREEINAGFVRRIDGKIRLIPVVIEPCRVPQALASTYRVSIKNLAAYESELGEIVGAIFGLSDKPTLGEAPLHAGAQVMPIDGLHRVDNLVLRTVCERCIETGNWDLTPESIWPAMQALDVTRVAMDESIEVLGREHYFKNRSGGHRVILLRPTVFGVHQYAQAYIVDLAGIITRIAVLIENEGLKERMAIASASEQPPFVADYVLQLLESLGKIDYAKPIGRDSYVSRVYPELKRMILD